MLNKLNKWWAYMHRNGNVSVKRLLDSRSIDDAEDSPFVAFVIGMVKAETREEAEIKLKKILRDRIGGIK